MTHLNIQQGSNVEIVTALIIKKLYEVALSVPEPSVGEEDAAYMSGNLQVNKAYRSLVEYLTNRFDDLNINVTVGYYIPFEDSAVLNVLLANNIGSDGIGITEAEAANATLTTGFFENNTDITSFNTFNLFTRANTNPPIALFKGCTNLASVNLSNIATIGEQEFYGCNNLNVSLNLSGLTSLGYKAFCYSGITSITNLGSITSIPGECFRGCTSLTSVTLPSFVTSIGQWGFADCHMTTMDLSHVTSLGLETFINSYLTTADLSNISSIGESCFSGTRLLGALNMPNLISLGSGAFSNCTGITSVDLTGSTIISIPQNCFSGCSNLTSVIFPTTIRTFNNRCFFGCKIGQIILPYGYIGNSGFTKVMWNSVGVNCRYLQYPSTTLFVGTNDMFRDSGNNINCLIVVLATTPPTTGYDPNNTGGFGTGFGWGRPDKASWYVPDSVVNDYKSATGWSQFANKIYPISQLQTDSPTYWQIYQANKDYGVPTQ